MVGSYHGSVFLKEGFARAFVIAPAHSLVREFLRLTLAPPFVLFIVLPIRCTLRETPRVITRAIDRATPCPPGLFFVLFVMPRDLGSNAQPQALRRSHDGTEANYAASRRVAAAENGAFLL